MTLDIALLNNPAAGDLITITKAATATVTLNFASPLPDDRYTLTIKDNLVDPANNKLDGESHQIEPQGPLFPTGDGVPGGNFVARFTVDSHPEIGNYVSQKSTSTSTAISSGIRPTRRRSATPPTTTSASLCRCKTLPAPPRPADSTCTTCSLPVSFAPLDDAVEPS